MLPIDLFALIFLRACLLALPISVGLLAFRRLLLSETLNAWLYALIVGFAAFSVAGLVPWAVGLADLPILFAVSAAVSPLIWLVTVVVCGIGRRDHYDLPDAETMAVTDNPAALKPRVAPLLLTDPVAPEAKADPVPVFRHRPAPVAVATTPGSVMEVARAMRGRATSEARRVRKLLPPPAPGPADLPFLR
ncbi:hypothetical protein GQ651_07680 [Alphaproteobacteria bacterium GH1-50]|uniref:Uncharacterized protein n=1 Tax=Kangsaoukella pontilimi TaxID=2691042 RepID=A0A7C9IQI3_9RHOB|nr:hypothetical protein [Kangsaoukella pontilimi]MXQ07723.1 hypothetical protein [Kangsaoukella pontilimi]